eukprot:m.86036 g.86036  ORF g.86036 m.86036 type:complete len:262 (-) comp8266_c0_seq1:392-1177(-)
MFSRLRVVLPWARALATEGTEKKATIVMRLGDLGQDPAHRALANIDTLDRTPSKRKQFEAIKIPTALHNKISSLKLGKFAIRTGNPALKRFQRQDKDADKEVGHPAFLARPAFQAAAAVAASLPPASMREIAFAGRSNVGKSSLLNALVSKPVARTSDKPGLTQTVNFFTVGDAFRIVDLPGYGFAFAKLEKIDAWHKLTQEYLATRKCLRRLYVLLGGQSSAHTAQFPYTHSTAHTHDAVSFYATHSTCITATHPTVATA